MNPEWVRALALVCTFAAAALAGEVLVGRFALVRSRAQAVQWRLKMMGRADEPRSPAARLRRAGSLIPRGLPPVIEAPIQKIERTLLQARLPWAVPRLLLLLFFAPLAIFFGLLLLVSVHWGIGISFGRLLLIAAFAAVAGDAIPLIALNWKAARNRKKMEEQFPVAVDIFVRGLRAGHPVASALDLLTQELGEPIGPEFAVVVDEVTYGADLKDALQAMADRWDLADMRMFVVSLSIQNETGGNLAEILENLSKVIRERHAMMMKVRALSSEGRITALMLTVLPLFTFTLLFVANPRFFFDVANDPMFVPGFTCLGILYLIGLVWVRRIVSLKV